MIDLLISLRSLVLALLLFVSPAIAEPAGQAGVVEESPPEPVVDGRAGPFCPHAGKIAPRGQNCSARRARFRRTRSQGVSARPAWTASLRRRKGRFRSSRFGPAGRRSGGRDDREGRLRPPEAKQPIEAISE
jgi:hypothetical protein